jgi:hypothetical protein
LIDLQTITVTQCELDLEGDDMPDKKTPLKSALDCLIQRFAKGKVLMSSAASRGEAGLRELQERRTQVHTTYWKDFKVVRPKVGFLPVIQRSGLRAILVAS